jgi:uncharacterized protein YjbJ (UPF0337 family)
MVNRNIVEGTGRDIGGTVKEGLGKALEDRDMQAEGAAEQVAGKTQKAGGHLEQSIEEIAGPVVDFVKRQPLLSAGIAAVAGFLLFRGGRK